MNYDPHYKFDTPLYPTGDHAEQAEAQQQFKSLTKAPTPGNNGVIVHAVGCSGNHLGKC